MKIYTKGGDKGYTSLWGGKRVSKSSLRIETYGTIDELNVYIGLIRDVLSDDKMEALLVEIQQQLFTFGAHLAADPDKKGLKLPKINQDHIKLLEKTIDEMEKELSPLVNFILPGGHVYVSYCHLGRVICRRAERITIALNKEEGVNPHIVKYLNRLSDFLFVLSRLVAKKNDAEELPWKPEK